MIGRAPVCPNIGRFYRSGSKFAKKGRLVGLGPIKNVSYEWIDVLIKSNVNSQKRTAY